MYVELFNTGLIAQLGSIPAQVNPFPLVRAQVSLLLTPVSSLGLPTWPCSVLYGLGTHRDGLGWLYVLLCWGSTDSG